MCCLTGRGYGPFACPKLSSQFSVCKLNAALVEKLKTEMKKPITERVAEDNAALLASTPKPTDVRVELVALYCFCKIVLPLPQKRPTSAPRTRPSIQKSDSNNSTGNVEATGGVRPSTGKQPITNSIDSTVKAGQKFVLRPYSGSGYKVECVECGTYNPVPRHHHNSGYV